MSIPVSYQQHIASLLAELGIPASYAAESGMQLHVEAAELASVGLDMYGREQRLTPATAIAWKNMQAAAAAAGEELLLVSGFRSVERQKEIWMGKLQKGQTVSQILAVNAAPGYSEHHTGRAIDIATSGQPPLTEAFEATSAYRWLAAHGSAFGFTMTYPRNNSYGVVYEPWHWAFTPAGG